MDVGADEYLFPVLRLILPFLLDCELRDRGIHDDEGLANMSPMEKDRRGLCIDSTGMVGDSSLEDGAEKNG